MSYQITDIQGLIKQRAEAKLWVDIQVYLNDIRDNKVKVIE